GSTGRNMDGSCGVRPIPILRVYNSHFVMAPRFANPAVPVERRHSAVADGDGHGRSHCRNRTLAMGKPCRSAFQPRDHIHVLSFGQSCAVGRGVLLRRAISLRGCRRRAGSTSTAGRTRAQSGSLCRDPAGRLRRFRRLLAELSISFFLMIAILVASNHKALAPHTRYFAAILIAAYIAFESPVSGMSANPARTFGPAVCGSYWHAIWIYFVAPSLGMLAAAEVFLLARQGKRPYCAKLDHQSDKRCIFCHSGHDLAAATKPERSA